MEKGTKRCWRPREWRTLSVTHKNRIEVCGKCAEEGRILGKEYQSLRLVGSLTLGMRCEARVFPRLSDREVSIKLSNALLVITRTPQTRDWLEQNDPKALKQAELAIAAYQPTGAQG